jgi:hypothetical protein
MIQRRSLEGANRPDPSALERSKAELSRHGRDGGACIGIITG